VKKTSETETTKKPVKKTVTKPASKKWGLNYNEK
jgi:hypothetical protein